MVHKINTRIYIHTYVYKYIHTYVYILCVNTIEIYSYVFMYRYIHTSVYIIFKSLYIYIYMVTPPPMIHLQAFYMGITSVLCTFLFTRKMTFSCFYFFYLLRKSPTQTHTHTHMQFCFCLLFCHFLRFWSKTQKTLRKPKKPKKTKLQDPCRYKLVS